MIAGTEHFFTSDKVLSEKGFYEVAGIPKADKEGKDFSIYEGIVSGSSYDSAYGIDKGTTSQSRDKENTVQASAYTRQSLIPSNSGMKMNFMNSFQMSQRRTLF